MDAIKSRRCGMSVRWKDRLVHAHHHARRFDDGVSCFAFFELKFVSRLIGDRGSDKLSTDIDLHMGSGGALFHSMILPLS